MSSYPFLSHNSLSLPLLLSPVYLSLSLPLLPVPSPSLLTCRQLPWARSGRVVDSPVVAPSHPAHPAARGEAVAARRWRLPPSDLEGGQAVAAWQLEAVATRRRDKRRWRRPPSSGDVVRYVV